MTLKQLMYFQKMSKVLNYTKAARELFISQPSLSYTIKELEKELAVSLFEKDPSTNRVRLTHDGALFAKYVSAALTNLEEGICAVKKQNAARQTTLRIGYIHTFPLPYINRIFHDYLALETNHDICFHKEISTSNSSLLEHLANRALHFAFCLSLDDSVIGIPFFRQELYVIVSKNHPLGNRSSVSFEELSQIACVRVPHASEVNAVVDDMYRRHNQRPIIGFEAGNMSASLAYVMDYECYTVAPLLSSMDTSQLAPLTVIGHPLARPIYFAWSAQQNFSELERAFYSFVVSRADRFSLSH